jgi:hypothetical protein
MILQVKHNMNLPNPKLTVKSQLIPPTYIAGGFSIT